MACSTGPLHIASALGINTTGLYPPLKPMHPGRWRPIGEKSEVLCANKTCIDCKKTLICHCIEAISPNQVCDRLSKLF